jgi:tetratricopeptide (TPR) repeat protein
VSRRTVPAEYDGQQPFGRLLRWHVLVWGTRPSGSPDAPADEPWIKARFAHAIGKSPDALDNYFAGINLPVSIGPIDRVLFGRNTAFTKWKSDLNARLEDAKSSRKSAAHSSPRRSRLLGLPTQIIRFVGREDELKRIHAMLSHGERAAVTQTVDRMALHGLGGIGKTALAVEYAHRFGEAYAGVFWCPASTLESLLASLASLGVMLGVASTKETDRREAANAALRRLATESKPWLLIYDDVPQPDKIADFLPTHGGRVLITSRFSDWKGWAEQIEIGVLPLEEAIAFLVERADREDDAGAKVLAQTLGCLPLALDHAAAFCKRAQMQFTEYAAKADRLVKIAPSSRHYPTSVFATFRLAMAEVAAHCPSSDALMAFLGQCGPERIPMTLIEGAIEDETDRLRSLASLAGLSLIRHEAFPDGTPAVTVHRLVQHVAFARATDDGTAGVAFDRLIGRLLHLYPKPEAVFNDRTCWPICDRLTPHVLAWLSRAETDQAPQASLSDLIDREVDRLFDRPSLARRIGNHVARILRIARPEAVRWPALLERVGHYLFVRASLIEAADLWRGLVRFSERLFGQQHVHTAVQLSNLGQVLADAGHSSEARRCFERSLAIHEQIYGPVHLDVATQLDHLAHIFRNEANFSAAEDYYRRAQAIRLQLLDPTHPDIALSLNYLAMIYRTKGDLPAARTLIEQALAIRTSALGPKHDQTVMLLEGLGAICHQQGDLDTAAHLAERLLAVTESTFGPEHPTTANDLSNLARVIHDQGDLERARPLLERALAIREKIFGLYHHRTAESLHNLGGLCLDQGEFVKAKEFIERALAVQQKLFGEDHPDVATSLHVLGCAMEQEGRFAEAQAFFERALAIREQTFGPIHPDVARSLTSLAYVLSAQGDCGSSVPLLRRALEIGAQVYGDRHQETAVIAAHLARVLQAEGMLDEAQATFEQALAILEKAYGANHLRTATCYADLASVFREIGDFARAQVLYERALDSTQKSRGEDHPATAAIWNSLADLLRVQRHFGEAHTYFDRALAIAETKLGHDHPDTNRVRCNLACLFLDEGLPNDALPLARAALEGHQEVLGREHPQTIISAETLIRVLEALGLTREAADVRATYDLA